MAALRLLGYLWALPLTWVAFILALFCDVRWHRWHRGVLWFACKRIPAARRFIAVTLGWVVFHRAGDDALSERTENHEVRHVQQCLVFGPLIVPLYLLGAVVARVRGPDWYRENPLERDARDYATQQTSLRRGVSGMLTTQED